MNVKKGHKLTTVLRARGRDTPANKTRKARSPISFSPESLRLARPLWTRAKMKVRANMATCINNRVSNIWYAMILTDPATISECRSKYNKLIDKTQGRNIQN